MKDRILRLLVCAGLLFSIIGCSNSPKWYKGNTHTHSFWSDGDDFPEMIALWYRDRGYDFLAISDHNNANVGQRWVSLAELRKRGGDVAIKKYQQSFGDKVQMRSSTRPATQPNEIRLRPFDEYRADLDRPGKFLLIQAQELSDKLEGAPIHINAANIAGTLKPQGGNSVREVIANNLKAIEEHGRKHNRPVLAHLNHPNFHYAITAEDMAAVIEERFFEVYNGHPIVNHLGDKDHPPVERLWDIANTIRIAELNAPPLMGLGTDDSHTYHVPGMNRARPGRGWIMVRASSLTPEALIAAMKTGDFYASSGVVLDDLCYDNATRTLTIDIARDGDARFTTQFIGTRDPSDRSQASASPYDPAQVGQVLATVEGRDAAYKLKGDELYVRAVVTSTRGVDDPIYKDQKKQAWTQPVGWEARIRNAVASAAAGQGKSMKSIPPIVAHRGASADAPENTLAAFKAAFDRGADAIEGDFYLTRDGKIICLHDADTKRVTGVAGKVAEMDFDRLRELDAGKWKGNEFAGQKLPTLPEVLSLVPLSKRFFIEIKCGPEIIPELKRILADSKVPADQLTIISFKDAVISEARKELPHIKAYWLFEFKETKGQWNLTPDQAVARALALGAHGIDIGVTAKTLPLVRELAPKAKAAGLELHVWTIDDPILAKEAITLGAASITTNRPGWLRGQLLSR